jgi:hypothetical protein
VIRGDGETRRPLQDVERESSCPEMEEAPGMGKVYGVQKEGPGLTIDNYKLVGRVLVPSRLLAIRGMLRTRTGP